MLRAMRLMFVALLLPCVALAQSASSTPEPRDPTQPNQPPVVDREGAVVGPIHMEDSPLTGYQRVNLIWALRGNEGPAMQALAERLYARWVTDVIDENWAQDAEIVDDTTGEVTGYEITVYAPNQAAAQGGYTLSNSPKNMIVDGPNRRVSLKLPANTAKARRYQYTVSPAVYAVIQRLRALIKEFMDGQLKANQVPKKKGTSSDGDSQQNDGQSSSHGDSRTSEFALEGGGEEFY